MGSEARERTIQRTSHFSTRIIRAHSSPREGSSSSLTSKKVLGVETSKIHGVEVGLVMVHRLVLGRKEEVVAMVEVGQTR